MIYPKNKKIPPENTIKIIIPKTTTINNPASMILFFLV